MESIEEDYFDLMYEPLAGSSLSNLLILLAQNKFRISIPYLPRLLYALTLSTLISPFRLKEHIKYDKKIRDATLSKDPVFIIGHWRSGTTFLHNVLSEDPQFGFCSTFHATLPGVFLSSEETLKPLLAASIPTTRPMDDVAMGPDLPQEEEYALANITPYGYYNGWCFPKNMSFYNQIVFLHQQSEKIQHQWKTTYHNFLQKLTLYRNGKQLLLKNPAHTARINTLLDLYPNAKFIHIHRNPYEIFCSMKKFMRIVLPRYCVQNPPDIKTIEHHIFNVYQSLYKTYLEQKTQIPPQHLIEIPYESFIQQPLQHLKEIYEHLQLGDFSTVSPRFNKYLSSQKQFKTSSYHLSTAMKNHIYQKWQFAFDAFHYSK